MNQGVDEPDHERGKQKADIRDRPSGATITVEHVNGCPKQGTTAEHHTAHDQPRCKVAPLDLLALSIRNVAKERAEKKRNGRSEQYRMQRMKRLQLRSA